VTPSQLSAIRERLDAADTDIRPDIDHIEEEFGFISGVRIVTRALPYDSGIGTEQDKDDKAHAFCDLMSHAKTDLRALLDEVERLRVERDDLLAWSQRFSDLVGVDGSTEAGRDDAFAKLYDAAKASGKLVKQ
jgi:hypothetical protein